MFPYSLSGCWCVLITLCPYFTFLLCIYIFLLLLQENNLVLQTTVQANLSNSPASAMLSNPGLYLHSHSHSHSHSHLTSPGAPGNSHSPTPTSSRTRPSMFPNMWVTPKNHHQAQTPKNHMATLRYGDEDGQSVSFHYILFLSVFSLLVLLFLLVVVVIVEKVESVIKVFVVIYCISFNNIL